MPSGRTHDRITFWLLPLVVIVSYLLTSNLPLTLMVAASFVFSGLMFGPDLDLISIQSKRWGKLGIIWLPYRKFLRHRSLFSHGLLIGTTIRILYLFSILILCAVLIVILMDLLTNLNLNWRDLTNISFNRLFHSYNQEIIAVFIGLELGAMSHSISDWSVSSYQRLYAKKSKKRTKNPKYRRK